MDHSKNLLDSIISDIYILAKQDIIEIQKADHTFDYLVPASEVIDILKSYFV